MKTFVSLLGFFALFGWPVLGQEAPKTKADLEAQTAKKSTVTTNETLTATASKISTKTLGPQITYSGFLVEFAKSDSPFKLIDPRTPINVQKDSDNLHRDPQTGKVRGFVLFAIKF